MQFSSDTYAFTRLRARAHTHNQPDRQTDRQTERERERQRPQSATAIVHTQHTRTGIQKDAGACMHAYIFVYVCERARVGVYVCRCARAETRIRRHRQRKKNSRQ
jgi:hypothetical protein